MKKKNMFVDDDADDRELFQEAVSEIDKSLILQIASSASQALEQLMCKDTPLPDVIFLDINMPVTGGWELLRQIKENTELSAIPVIMYSTSSNYLEKERAITTGAIGLVSKPSSFETLKEHLQKIRDYLDQGHLPAVLNM